MKSTWFFVIACLLVLLISSCSLNFIKRRLTPPHPVQGGILFQYEAPSARIVNLAGDFPDILWDSQKQPMYDDGTHGDKEAADGIWSLIKTLTPGRYQYKFVIDRNSWVADPNNFEVSDDGYGGKNSVIVVLPE
jgi:1,4-alpha-glucan branching enzyme